MGLQAIFSLLLISCIFGVGNGFAPRRSPLGNPHIVGGVEVDIEEVPYQVSIRRFFNHYCGASIIGKYYALSAAHCFHDRHWTIWYGVSAGSDHIRQGSYKPVRSITSHPKFVWATSDYDVAVVRIWWGFTFGSQIVQIEPVPPGKNLATETTLVVSGWGKTSQFSPELSERLKKAEVQVIDYSKCKEVYIELTERMFCAGVEDGSQDSCGGDSGGPIVHVESGLQVGVVSWGIGCGNAQRPGVYTDLSNIEISQFIAENTIN